jgi:hypothetical protein
MKLFFVQLMDAVEILRILNVVQTKNKLHKE